MPHRENKTRLTHIYPYSSHNVKDIQEPTRIRSPIPNPQSPSKSLTSIPRPYLPNVSKRTDSRCKDIRLSCSDILDRNRARIADLRKQVDTTGREKKGREESENR